MQLITGASGFLGQHLVSLLHSQGKNIRALYHKTPPPAQLQLPGIEWMQCNLLDIYQVEDAMSGAENVYHCAAVVSFLPGMKQDMLHTNVEGTANVVNEALERGIQKLAYVSSIAALGRGGAAAKEITEEEQWEESHNSSAYGQSKFMAEMEVWRGIGEGLNAVIVNPGIILGEPFVATVGAAKRTDWSSDSLRLLKIADRQFPFYTEGITGWVDVKDVARALQQLMDSDIEAERFILVAENQSYRQIFTWLAQSLGKKPPHIHATGWMTEFIWRWNALRNTLGAKVTITKETARTAQATSIYNNTKLKSSLPGFVYTGMEEAIMRIGGAFLKNG